MLDTFADTLVATLKRDELLRALASVINGLFGEVDEVQELARKVEPQLRELTVAWDTQVPKSSA